MACCAKGKMVKGMEEVERKHKKYIYEYNTKKLHNNQNLHWLKTVKRWHFVSTISSDAQHTQLNSPWYNGAASLTSHWPTCHTRASNWREREGRGGQSQTLLFSSTVFLLKVLTPGDFYPPSSSLPPLSPAALSSLSSLLQPPPSSAAAAPPPFSSSPTTIFIYIIAANCIIIISTIIIILAFISQWQRVRHTWHVSIDRRRSNSLWTPEMSRGKMSAH